MTNANEITAWLIRTSGKRSVTETPFTGTREQAMAAAKEIAERSPKRSVVVFRVAA